MECQIQKCKFCHSLMNWSENCKVQTQVFQIVHKCNRLPVLRQAGVHNVPGRVPAPRCVLKGVKHVKSLIASKKERQLMNRTCIYTQLQSVTGHFGPASTADKRFFSILECTFYMYVQINSYLTPTRLFYCKLR